MQYGMIGYYVPHRLYPAGYHCDPRQPLPFAGLASQKNHMSLYLMSMYEGGDELEWFRAAWAKTGRRLDMGKCCIRFKRLEDVPLEVISKAVARVPVRRFIARYEAALAMSKRAAARRSASKVAATGKAGTARAAKKNTARPARKTVARSVSKAAGRVAAARKRPKAAARRTARA